MIHQRLMKNYLTISVGLRVVAAILLFVALANLPYQFFSILRLITCFVSAYLVYVAVVTKRQTWIVPFSFIFLLFLPLRLWVIKRETWMIIDGLAAIFFLTSIIFIRERPQAED
jgi:hypothetical protein